MTETTVERRICNAWIGRISGCMLGKPVEMLSMRHGAAALGSYLDRAGAVPLRDYVPLVPGTPVERHADCCKDGLVAAVPDDDINYTVLSLMLLEERGTDFTTEDVARAWFRWLPAMPGCRTGAKASTAPRPSRRSVRPSRRARRCSPQSRPRWSCCRLIRRASKR